MSCSDTLDWYLVSPVVRKIQAMKIHGHLGGELPVDKNVPFSKNTT